MNLKFLIKLSRPIFWPILPLIYLGDLVVAGVKFDSLNWNIFLEIIYLSCPFCILIYGVNDVYDWESDKMNERKGGIEGLKLRPNYHKSVLKISLFIAVVFLIIVSLSFNLLKIFDRFNFGVF